MRRISLFVLGVAAAASALAFDPITDESGIYVVTWDRGTIPVVNNLPTDAAFLDGSTFRSSYDASLARWNELVGNVQFSWTHGTTGAYQNGNDINEVALDDTIGGFAFGEYTLAVTLSYTDGANTRVESDVIFNDAWTWDSYRGNLLPDKEDARRVALHELGHVLGLDHPDQANPAQSVSALMNSVVSDLDALVQDDIDGGRFLYGAPSSPPANDAFANAIAITLSEAGSATVSGTNVQSTSESGEPVLDSDDPGGRSVWWKWTAPANGMVEVTTLGSRFDTVLGVFQGSVVNDLTRIGMNDDVWPGVVRSSALTFLARGGETYTFMVDGWGGYEGRIVLNLRRLAAPPPVATIARQRVIAPLGEDLSMSVTASAAIGGPLSYQWRWNNQIIPGATGSSYTLQGVTNADVGSYTVEVLEAGGTSAYATTFVLPSYQSTYVTIWGTDPTHGTDQVPDGLDDVIMLAGGGTHALALRANGTVAGWGGQSSSALYNRDQEIPPEGLTDAVAIAAGETHSLALKADGTVVAWGGARSLSRVAVVPPDLKNVVAIAAGSTTSVALLADGTVALWGLDSQTLEQDTVPRDVVAVDLVGSRGFTRHTDGRVRVWDGSFKQEYTRPDLPVVDPISAGGNILGLGLDGRVYMASATTGGSQVVPDFLQDVVALESAGQLSYAVKANGTVVVWETGTAGPNLDALIPDTLAGVLQVESSQVMMALSVGDAVNPPVIVAAPENLILNERDTAVLEMRVAGDNPFQFTWKFNGDVVENSDRIAGAGTARLVIEELTAADAGTYTLEVTNTQGMAVSEAVELTVLGAVRIVEPLLTTTVVEGEAIHLAVSAIGSGTLVYQWQHNGELIPGATGSTYTVAGAALANAGRYAVQVADDRGQAWSSAFVHVAAREATVLAWEGDWLGIKYPAPHVPGTTQPVVQVGVFYHGLSVLADGQVLAWGTNKSGSTVVPFGLSDVVQVALGADFSVALRGDGTVVAWGKNVDGQCDVPDGLDHVVKVGAGFDYGVAVRTDGSVVAWGKADRIALIPPRLDDVVDLSIYGNQGVLLHRDGRISTWGGTRAPPEEPGDMVKLAAGPETYAGILRDGTVRAWVWDSPGLFGDPFTALSGVAGLSQGLTGGLAVHGDGTLTRWNHQGTVITDGVSQVSDAVGVAAGTFVAAIVRASVPNITEVSPDVEVTAVRELLLSVQLDQAGSYVFEWFRDGEPVVPSANVTIDLDGTLRIARSAVGDTGAYTVRVSNAAGSVASSPVAVAVRTRPEPATWPTSRSVVLGEALSVDLTSAEDGVDYQWFHEGELMTEQTGPVLLRPKASVDDAGYYRVIMTGVEGGEVIVGFTLNVVARDSTLVAWGNTASALVRPPSGLSNVVQYSNSGDHLLVLFTDGRVVAFGNNDYGQCDVPVGLADVVQVSAGQRLSLALCSDGTVVQWGQMQYLHEDVPADLPPIAAVRAGASMAIALSAEGRVYRWGYRRSGDPDPSQFARVAQVAAFSKSGQYGLVFDDGTLFEYDPSNWRYTYPVTEAQSGISRFEAYSNKRFAVTREGALLEWQSQGNAATAWSLGAAGRARELSTGLATLVLLRDGTFVSNATSSVLRAFPSGVDRAYQVSNHGSFNLALVPNQTDSLRWLQLPSSVAPLGGESFTLRAEVGGAVAPSFQWFFNGIPLADGSGISGATTSELTIGQASQLNAGRYSLRVTDGARQLETPVVQVAPVTNGPPPVFTKRPLSQIVREGDPVVMAAEVLQADRYQWRRNRQVVAGADTATLSLEAATPADAGLYELWAVNENGAVDSTIFQLTVARANQRVEEIHLGSSALYAVPRDLVAPAAIYASAQTNLVLQADGSLRAWGEADDVSLSKINAQTGLVLVSPWGASGLAVTAEGRLTGWGAAEAFAQRSAEFRDVVDVVLANDWALVLFADGSVYSSSIYYEEPFEVPTELGAVIEIASAGLQASALRSDGSVVSWSRSSTVLIDAPSTFSDLVRMELAGTRAVGQRSDGALVEWPLTGESSRLPVLTSPPRDFALDGTNSTAIVNSAGRVVVYTSPTAVDSDLFGTLFGVFDVAFGINNSLALVSTIAPVFDAQPIDVVAAANEDAVFSASATGDGAVGYIWRFRGEVITDSAHVSGSRTATLTIHNVGEADYGDYDVLAHDGSGGTWSESATLWLSEPFVAEPIQHALMLSGEAFELDSGVVIPPDYAATVQWYEGETGDVSRPIGGANGPVLDLGGRTEAGRFWMRFSPEVGEVVDGASVVVLPVSRVALQGSYAPDTNVSSANGLLFASSISGCAVSTDGGLTWTETDFRGRSAAPVAYGDGVYLMPTVEGVFRSENGIDWPTSVLGYNTEQLVFGDGRFIARVINPNDVHFSDDAGDSWTRITAGDSPARMVYGSHGWVASIKNSGQLLTSEDGSYWTRGESITVGTIDSMTFANGVYLGVTHFGAKQYTVRSSDGIAWTASEPFVDLLPETPFAQSVAGGNGLFVAASSDRVSISDDAVQWDTRSRKLDRMRSVAFGRDRFLFFDGVSSVYLSASVPVQTDFSVMAVNRTAEWGTSLSLEAPVALDGSSYEWFVGESGDASNPVAGATSRTLDVTLTESTAYWVRVTNAFHRDDSPTLSVDVVVYPVEITTGPQRATVVVDTAHTISVEASGTGPRSYRWYRNGVELDGQTSASITLNPVTLSDGGSYEVEVSNAFETVRSGPAWLSVLPAGSSLSALQVPQEPRYRPAGEVSWTSTLTFDPGATDVGWSVLLPAGWTLTGLGNSSAVPSGTPSIGDADLLEWSWASPGESPLTFTYTLTAPASQRGPVEFVALAELSLNGAQLLVLAEPDPTTLLPGLHSADIDGDFRLGLSELLRVIELYNTRFGTSRTGRYRLSEDTEDGFGPDARALGEGEANVRFHSADFDQDGRLSLSELLRVIELYNTRSGTTRTGAYRADPDSTDGFAPGADI